MTLKFKLVPDTGVQQLPVSPSVAPTANLEIESKEQDTVIQLMSKNLQKKATLIMHYLKNKISLTKEGNVVYPDQSVGSNLYDLLKYFTTPKHMSPPRPFDASEFQQLMNENGVPLSALGSGKSLDRTEKLNETTQKHNTLKHWKTLYN